MERNQGKRDTEYKIAVDYVRPGVLMIKFGEKVGNDFIWTKGEKLEVIDDNPGETISHLFHIMAERLHEHYYDPVQS